MGMGAANTLTGGKAGQVATQALYQARSVGAPPPAPPDLTDKAVQQSRLNQIALLMAGRGRASTFLTGGNGASILGG